MSMSENEQLIWRVRELLVHVHFPEYGFLVAEKHGGVMLWGEYMEPDSQDWHEGPTKQVTRKWRLTPEMTDSEIIQTVFKLCLTSYEHRAREWFRYRGQQVFGPHFNVEECGKAGGRG